MAGESNVKRLGEVGLGGTWRLEDVVDETDEELEWEYRMLPSLAVGLWPCRGGSVGGGAKVDGDSNEGRPEGRGEGGGEGS